MQGYLFAHPGPPETIEALLRPGADHSDLHRLYSAIQAVSETPVST
jgi:hypothetical protein